MAAFTNDPRVTEQALGNRAAGQTVGPGADAQPAAQGSTKSGAIADTETAAAGLGAGAQLVSGLLSAQAKKKQTALAIGRAKENEAIASQAEGIRRLGEGQQQAMSNLMKSFGRALTNG